MLGASLDLNIKIQKARMAQQSLGTECTLLPDAKVAAAVRKVKADAVPLSMQHLCSDALDGVEGT